MSHTIQFSLNEEAYHPVVIAAGPELTVAKLKYTLVQRVEDAGGSSSSSVFHWIMSINDKVIDNFTAANLRLISFGPNPKVLLLNQKVIGARQKRRRDEEQLQGAVKQVTKTPSYDMVKKLLSLVAEQQNARRSSVASEEERHSNGLNVHQVTEVLGMIKAKIPTTLSILIETQPGQVLPNVKSDVRLWPVFGPGHVSLMCKFDNARTVNLDASGVAMYVSSLSSRTFVNYQTHDETRIIEGVHLAGGNCAIFVGIQAIRSIVHYTRYAKMKAPFSVFWGKFVEVLKITNGNSLAILLNTFMALVQGSGGGSGVSEANASHVMMIRQLMAAHLPPAMLIEAMQSILTHISEVQAADYLADIMMLDLFLDTKIGGFEKVSLLGNILRTYLKDIHMYGFVVGGDMVSEVERSRANAVQLAAWLMLNKISNITQDEVAIMETKILDHKMHRKLDVDAFEAKFPTPKKMAEEILFLHFNKRDTGPQMLARTFLDEPPAAAQPLAAAAPTFNSTLPLPEGAREVKQLFSGGRGSVAAMVNPNVFHRTIRVSKAIFQQSLETNQLLVLLVDKQNPSVATLARIEASHNLADSIIEISPMINESLAGARVLWATAYINVPPAKHIVFEIAASGGYDVNLIRIALEGRLNFAPGITNGELMEVSLGLDRVTHVRVKQINPPENVQFAGIPNGEISFEIEESCAACNSALVSSQCGECKSVYYCSEECQKAHWEIGGHEKNCK